MPTADCHDLERLLERDRDRLVRFCAHVAGDANAAEDLAQETMIEAWRLRDRLYDSSGGWQWLTAIARNITMRWRRINARHQSLQAPPGSVAAEHAAEAGEPVEIDVELERSELADLLDKALALLPADTRTALIARYVEQAPVAQIGALLNLSEGAVAVRLHRGKLALRQLLATELYEEASALGLRDDAGGAEWVETRIWCPWCGSRRLMHNRREMARRRFLLHCPACYPDFPRMELNVSNTDLANPALVQAVGGVKSCKAVMTRMMGWVLGYYLPALESGAVSCSSCGATIPVQLEIPQQFAPQLHDRRGLFLLCARCGYYSIERLPAIGLCLPAGQAFWRDHPRMHTLPIHEIETAGAQALVCSFAEQAGTARLDVVFAADSYRVLHVNQTTN